MESRPTIVNTSAACATAKGAVIFRELSNFFPWQHSCQDLIYIYIYIYIYIHTRKHEIRSGDVLSFSSTRSLRTLLPDWPLASSFLPFSPLPFSFLILSHIFKLSNPPRPSFPDLCSLRRQFSTVYLLHGYLSNETGIAFSIAIVLTREDHQWYFSFSFDLFPFVPDKHSFYEILIQLNVTFI